MAQSATNSNFTTVDASGGYYVNGTQVIDNTGAYIGGVLPADLALAQGSVFIGNASNVAAAVSAKTSGQILVGNGTTLASVAVSGDATLASTGAVTVTKINGATLGTTTATSGNILVGSGTQWASVSVSSDATLASTGALTISNGAVTRAKMSAPASLKNILCNAGTIATTGTVVGYVKVPATGTLSSIGFVAASNLAANDTNYITFTCTNVTQSKTLFANDATENTKLTGGTAITADGLRYFTLTGTSADLNVTAGDLIKVTATVTGTLANAVNSTTYSFDFTGTT